MTQTAVLSPYKVSNSYERIKKALANEMFKRFPRAPLATLIWTLKMGKLPTESEFQTLAGNKLKICISASFEICSTLAIVM